jgi:hypothetical protein
LYSISQEVKIRKPESLRPPKSTSQVFVMPKNNTGR